MKKYLESFLLMIQFLTRIPVNKSLPCEKEDFRRGSMFLPVIGFIIGAIQWILYFILSKALPSNIISVILVLSGILLTGALHLDGLGDTCDGFYAFKGKDRIIEIMKDSRIGTYACAAIVFDILIKISAYNYLVDRNLHLFIIAVPVISRFCLDFLAFIGKNAKSTGTGNLFIGNVGKKEIIVAIVLTILVTLPLLGPVIASLSLVISLVFTILFNRYCTDKIDGLTGDTLGANNELVEILLLILLCSISFAF